MIRFGIIILLLLFSCENINREKAPEIQNGLLDLRGYDLAQKGPLDLNGPWEFYWQKFLPPGEDRGGIPAGKTGYSVVPYSWDSAPIDGKILPHFGYATYRLKIFLEKPLYPLALKINSADNPFVIYINGNKLASSGKNGNSPETSQPAYVSKVSEFICQDSELEIILHRSNFHTRYSGRLDDASSDDHDVNWT